MSLFGKKKARFQENAGMDGNMGPQGGGYEELIPQMNFSVHKEEGPVEGFSSPDETGGGRRDAGSLKRFILFALSIVLLIVVVAGLFAMLSGAPDETGAPRGVSVDEQQQMARLQEEQQMREKIALLENQNKELLSQIDQMSMTVDSRITDRMSAILEELKAQQNNSAGGAEVLARLDEMQAEQESLRRQLTSLGDENMTVNEDGEVVKRERKEGSSGNTLVFNTIAERETRRQEAESSLRASANKQAAYDLTPGVPTGTNVPAKLKTMMISSTLLDRFHVVAETTEEYEFMPGIVLPKGVRFIGKATPDFDARRILVDVNLMQYGNAEIKMEGVMLDGRANPGMVTKYSDPLVNGLPLIFLSSILSSTATMAQETTESYTWNGTAYDRPKWNTENILLEGAGDALDNFSDVLMHIYARKKPVIQVKRNIPVYVQFTHKMPLSTLLGAGVARYKTDPAEGAAEVRGY